VVVKTPHGVAPLGLSNINHCSESW